jgi:hypothetical protein
MFARQEGVFVAELSSQLREPQESEVAVLHA